jgi:hypothetical protein
MRRVQEELEQRKAPNRALFFVEGRRNPLDQGQPGSSMVMRSPYPMLL